MLSVPMAGVGHWSPNIVGVRLFGAAARGGAAPTDDLILAPRIAATIVPGYKMSAAALLSVTMQSGAS
jgi:hypothetical protein